MTEEERIQKREKQGKYDGRFNIEILTDGSKYSICDIVYRRDSFLETNNPRMKIWTVCLIT